MLTSSLIADDPARGNEGGGGVCAGASRCQKSLPLVFLEAPMLNAPNKPLVVELSMLMPLSLSSSGTPSSGPSNPGTAGNNVGDDCAVTEGRSKSSLSRTWRMISASRRTSLSMGAASSRSSALIRPNCLDFG